MNHLTLDVYLIAIACFALVILVLALHIGAWLGAQR